MWLFLENLFLEVEIALSNYSPGGGQDSEK